LEAEESDLYMTHADDFEYAPADRMLSTFHKTLVSKATIQKLTTFAGEKHTYTGHAYALRGLRARNISTWLSANLTIGTDSFIRASWEATLRTRRQFSPLCSMAPARRFVGYSTYTPRNRSKAFRYSVRAEPGVSTWEFLEHFHFCPRF